LIRDSFKNKNYFCNGGLDLHLLKVPTPKLTTAGSSTRSMKSGTTDELIDHF